MQEFSYTKDGKEEKITPETWVWHVRYSDTEVLHQFDLETGLFHQFKEIDLYRPFVFQMTKFDDPDQRFTLLYNPETMKLFHFYRNGILENLTKRVRLYVFGCKQNNKTTYFAIMPDGELVITDDIDLIHF